MEEREGAAARRSETRHALLVQGNEAHRRAGNRLVEMDPRANRLLHRDAEPILEKGAERGAPERLHGRDNLRCQRRLQDPGVLLVALASGSIAAAQSRRRRSARLRAAPI